jgi:hypothetical protein
MAKYNTDEIINSSYENVKALSKRLKDLDDMHKTIKSVVDENTQIPIYFKNIVNEVNDSTHRYLEGHKNVLNETINQFEKEISELEKHSKDLNGEINRLNKIDLKAHFEQHQGKLSEVFNSINGIQNNLTSLSQNILNISQSISNIDNKTESNFKKIITDIENQGKIILVKIEKLEKYIQTELKQINNSLSKFEIQFEKQIEKNKKQTIITWILIGLVLITSIIGLIK